MNTMFSTHAIRLAYGRTLMDGGSSLLTSDGYDFEVPYKGFMVGGLSGETKIPLDICDANTFHTIWLKYAVEVRKLIKESKLSGVSYAVGTWVDNDCIVFDVSEKVAHSRSAYALCKERNEDAYYDVEASKSVFIEKDNDNEEA
tara:strand:+ start:20 stop:451 length:432 start_codon:yes stop_codon:yes gene_type:complete